MTEYQIYNDLAIELPITKDGEAVSLTGKTVNVYVVCNRFKKEMTVTTSGNTISFTFYGKDQVVRGEYNIEVWISKGSTGQMMIPYKSYFKLIG